MPLINRKIHLELNWSKDCVMSTIADATFEITNTKLQVPIVTLSSKDNVKLVKLLEKGFKRPVYWNEYQTKIQKRDLDNNNLTRFPLDTSFQGVRRLFVLAFNNTTVDVPNNTTNNTNNRVERNSYTKYFLPRVNIIDRRNFYDQPINDQVKNYHEIRNIATEQGDDYMTGCLLDYQYFKDHYQLIAVDLSKQKALDAEQLICLVNLFSVGCSFKKTKEESLMHSKKIISKGRNPNKILVDEEGEFYNKLFKRFLKINNIEIYSTYKGGKSAVAERFFRMLKNKVFKHMTAVSKNVYFVVLINTMTILLINTISSRNNKNETN